MSDRSLPAAVRARLAALASGVRLGKFAGVGLAGFFVDNAVLAAVVEGAGLAARYAKPVSAEAAIVVMFLANDRWTFAEAGGSDLGALLARFLRSNLVRAGGVLVAWGVLVALHELLGLHYLLANTLGIGAGFVVNYVAESLFTWRVHR